MLVDRLIDSNPFDYDYLNDSLFVDCMKECISNQISRSSFYRGLLKAKSFTKDIQSISSIEDLWDYRLFISVYVLKEFVYEADFLISDIEVEIFSSGTTQKPSRMVLDKITLNRIKKIVFNVYQDYGLTDLENEYNYLFFTYEDLSLGTAFSDVLLSELAPKMRDKFFALKKKGDSFFFDLEGVIKKLQEFQDSGLGLRILGFPAYIYYTIQELQKRNLKFNFCGVVLPGGGWKTHKQEISVTEFKKLVKEYLGINQVRDLYGMVEHGIPYVECEYDNKHIPRYSRVRTFNPLTRGFNSYEEIGLLSFMTPYASSYTISNVISSDVGFISFGCRCGRKAPYIVLVGRAGTTKLKGCAISALEFLKYHESLYQNR
ncbi:MAG: hypothetical protein ABDH21_02525 [bacterium]